MEELTERQKELVRKATEGLEPYSAPFPWGSCFFLSTTWLIMFLLLLWLVHRGGILSILGGI